eukprot:TRINITY_DN388_c4_g1_i1.p1 TRINITY_DN388_c4_g1~~TRINITY_DN388_c4_g1_i1.p1  ORF type:complete len:737 (+),score=227.30 TRINITY_DN388_c4_g1_i1:804-3014(+)
MAEETKELLKKILTHHGVADREIKNTLKDKKQVDKLLEVLAEAKIDLNTPKVEEETINLLMELARKFPDGKHRQLVVDYILKKKIGEVQLGEAIKYLKKLEGELNVADFEKQCGVGVVVTAEEIKAGLSKILSDHKEEFGPEPGKKSGLVWKYVRQSMPFAVPSDVKVQLDLLLNPPKETKEREDIYFPKPEENIQKTPALLEEHLKATGGKIYTRFPPEPNGYLHIGHAKAMQLNFGYAKRMGGVCYMRFDDTNPETESTEYVESILDNVKWMGHEYWKITYASDYFDKLYELAIELIKRGHAYVCHQTAAEIDEGRKTHTPSPYRTRSVEENLKLFEDMKNGKFEEGKAILRMKQDMNSENSTMWDLVAYRIKFCHHHRSGDKWCIYPSYDFTHCLNDSLENITHSLCTLEFVPRREPYNWLVDSLGLYRSVVWEYARLELTHVVLSKRKLIKLVKDNYVKGWDDPRLPTIQGLRRRGYSPEGINNFCIDIRVTRNNSVIPYERLEELVRKDLNETSRRCFAVFDPIKLTIKNWTGGVIESTCPNVPKKPERGEHKLPFTNTIYIERDDFKEHDEKDYFGLALNSNPPKFVKLKYADVNIKLVDVVRNGEGKIVELLAEHDPKAVTKHAIHWIAIVDGKEPLKAEIRNYERLFNSEEPIKKMGDNWLQDLNKNSLEITSALVDPSVRELKPLDRVQFERVGYYCLDPDTNAKNDHFVFNRSVTLKESTWKKSQK